jgi:hypothetical protein
MYVVACMGGVKTERERDDGPPPTKEDKKGKQNNKNKENGQISGIVLVCLRKMSNLVGVLSKF